MNIDGSLKYLIDYGLLRLLLVSRLTIVQVLLQYILDTIHIAFAYNLQAYILYNILASRRVSTTEAI